VETHSASMVGLFFLNFLIPANVWTLYVYTRKIFLGCVCLFLLHFVLTLWEYIALSKAAFIIWRMLHKYLIALEDTLTLNNATRWKSLFGLSAVGSCAKHLISCWGENHPSSPPPPPFQHGIRTVCSCTINHALVRFMQRHSSYHPFDTEVGWNSNCLRWLVTVWCCL
jgi:hypothetical protein